VGVLEYSPELKNFFANDPVLRERLWINDIPFTVVGVVESKTALGGISSGGTLYLPISTLPCFDIETSGFDQIYCQASSRAKLETAMHHATEVLRRRY
jgi:hypothetical protein